MTLKHLHQMKMYVRNGMYNVHTQKKWGHNEKNMLYKFASRKITTLCKKMNIIGLGTGGNPKECFCQTYKKINIKSLQMLYLKVFV